MLVKTLPPDWILEKSHKINVWEHKFEYVRRTLNECRYGTEDDKEYFVAKAEKAFEDLKYWLETIVDFDNITLKED